MTIENVLERIATALEGLVKNQNPLAHQVTAIPVVTATATTTNGEKRGPGRPSKAEIAARETAVMKPATTTANTPAAADENLFGEDSPEDPSDFLNDTVSTQPAKVYVKEDVRKALVDFGKKNQNPEKARQLLKMVGGVDTLVALREDKFADVIDACNA